MRPVLTSIHKGNGKKSLRATAIEYGLIAAGISVAIIAVVNGLGCKAFDSCKDKAGYSQTK